MDVQDLLRAPLVAHLATDGPTVRPIWFLYEDEAFWWITGDWSRLATELSRNAHAALVVDTCDLASGTVLQVNVHGRAEITPFDRGRAVRKLSKYLGPDLNRWSPDRFINVLDDPNARLGRLRPSSPPALRDLSFAYVQGS